MRLFPVSAFLVATLLAAGTAAAQQPTSTKKAARAAAKQKIKTKKAKAAAPQPTETAPAVVFSRTPCLGTCPHYTATIYPDGRVAYEGFSHAPVEGKRELKLSVSTVNTILAEARALNFITLPDRYTQGATDLPATTLTIRQATGPAKSVVVEEGAPADVNNLLRYVEKQITDALGVTADQ